MAALQRQFRNGTLRQLKHSYKLQLTEEECGEQAKGLLAKLAKYKASAGSSKKL